MTERIEKQVWHLLKWENPARSGFTLTFLVGSILLTRSYSLLQLAAAMLTIAIGLNLAYVNFVMQTQRVFSEGNEVAHPYRYSFMFLTRMFAIALFMFLSDGPQWNDR